MALGNVQAKIPCLFQTVVLEERSSKRHGQPFKVVAGDTIRESAKDDDVHQALASEKLDGTCVYIAPCQGKPWLWARLDRKPAKLADKRFKKFQAGKRQWELDEKQGPEPTFHFDHKTDFKSVPGNWIHACGVPVVDGIAQCDENGHIPGWVPVDPASRQHCWHLTTVDLDQGLCLVLQPATDSTKHLEIVIKKLSELEGTTCELIGTNINGNPYRLGSKQNPIHLLVRHGSIHLDCPPPIEWNGLKNWFTKSSDGAVEGVVWHCRNGRLYKLHRHHMELNWPVDNLRLCKIPVDIKVDLSPYDGFSQQLFVILADLKGETLPSISDLPH